MHYQETILWKKSMTLAESITKVTRGFDDPQDPLHSSLFRYAIRLPSNIAQGWTAELRDEKIRHLARAHGACNVLTSLLIVGERCGLLEREKSAPMHALIEEISRMLTSVRRRLRDDWPARSRHADAPTATTVSDVEVETGANVACGAS